MSDLLDDNEKELTLINAAQKKFVCEYFKESYEVLGIDTNNELGDEK